MAVFLFACGSNGRNILESEYTEATLSPIAFPIQEETHYGEPYLFTDGHGQTYMSWRETNEGVHLLRYAKLKEEAWTEPVTIASGSDWFVNWADYPQMVAFSQGDLLSFYLEKSGPSTFSYDIKLTRSADGSNWEDPKILHDDGKKVEHGFVSMLPYNDNVFIAWLDGRNTSDGHGEGHAHGHGGKKPMTLRGAIVDNKGNKLQEWELDNSVCDCCQTTAAMTDNGPVVIYRDRSLTEVRNINIVRLLNGKWTDPEPIYNDNWKIKGCPVNGPRTDSKGNNLAIAWFAEVHGQAEVKVIFSEDGGATFDRPIRINEEHTIGRVDLVMLDSNTAVVTWMEGPLILARRVNKDRSLGPIITIAESSDNRSSGFPQITINNNSLIFAWTDSNELYSTVKTAFLKDF
ncbi:MAG TPA: hypothetical protein VK921_08160 [Anditalea sp.]|nr:hypothetical protein [Anditalea sp.]